MAASSLHIGSRVLSPPSTSARSPAAPVAGLRCRRSGAPPPLPRHASRAAAGPPGAGPDSQAHRFKYIYTPGSPQQKADALGAPLSERDAGGGAGHSHAWGYDEPLDPQTLWPPAGGAGAISLPNPDAQRFRIKQVTWGAVVLRVLCVAACIAYACMGGDWQRRPRTTHATHANTHPQAPIPVPMSFPGSDYWEVEILRDYSKDWPRLEKGEAGWRLRAGFLAPLADPKLVPFFFYRGIEQVGTLPLHAALQLCCLQYPAEDDSASV